MTNDIEERWAALAGQFAPRVPIRAHDGYDEVRPGQLREAIWNQREATVLVVDVDDVRAEVIVNPVSLEPGVADANTVILEGELSPMRGGVAIWPNISATMSFVVLYDLVAELPDDILATLLTRDEQSSKRLRHGGSPRFGSTPLPGSGAERAIDELFDSIDELASVRPHRPSTPEAQKQTKFPLGLTALIETLEITQATAMAVIKGQRTLSSDQAEAVARVAGVSIEDVLAAARPLPDDLVRELMEPRWRSTIRGLARSGDEDGAREELGRRAFALAARGKGSGRELWRQRIQAVLAAESA